MRCCPSARATYSQNPKNYLAQLKFLHSQYDARHMNTHTRPGWWDAQRMCFISWLRIFGKLTSVAHTQMNVYKGHIVCAVCAAPDNAELFSLVLPSLWCQRTASHQKLNLLFHILWVYIYICKRKKRKIIYNCEYLLFVSTFRSHEQM